MKVAYPDKMFEWMPREYCGTECHSQTPYPRARLSSSVKQPCVSTMIIVLLPQTVGRAAHSSKKACIFTKPQDRPDDLASVRINTHLRTRLLILDQLRGETFLDS